MDQSNLLNKRKICDFNTSMNKTFVAYTYIYIYISY